MIKILTIVFSLIFAGSILYLIVPLPHLGERTLTDEFVPEQPTKFILNQSEKKQKCQDESFYITKDQIGYADSEIIDERCANLQRDLANSVIDGDLVKMRLLFQNGASAQSRAFSKYSGDAIAPVIRAVWEKQTHAAKLLLDNGADVNSEYYCCMTSKSLLMVAVHMNDEATTRLLLARNADLSFKDRFDGLDVFDEAYQINNPVILDMLSKAMCDRSIAARIKCRVNRASHLFR